MSRPVVLSCKTDPEHRVQAMYYDGGSTCRAAMVQWARALGFAAERERGKVVIVVDRQRREDVVIHPGYWLVIDRPKPRRRQQAQSWDAYELSHHFAREGVAA